MVDSPRGESSWGILQGGFSMKYLLILPQAIARTGAITKNHARCINLTHVLPATIEIVILFHINNFSIQILYTY